MFKLARLFVDVEPDLDGLESKLEPVRRRLLEFGKSNPIKLQAGIGGASGGAGGSTGAALGLAGNAIAGAMSASMRGVAAAALAAGAGVQAEARRWGAAIVSSLGKIAGNTRVSARDTQRTEARRQAAQAAVIADRNQARFTAAWEALRTGNTSRRTIGARIDRTLPITAAAAGAFGQTMGYREWSSKDVDKQSLSRHDRQMARAAEGGSSPATVSDSGPLADAAKDIKDAARILRDAVVLAIKGYFAATSRATPAGGPGRATPAGGPRPLGIGFTPKKDPAAEAAPESNKHKGPYGSYAQRDERGRFMRRGGRRGGFITPELMLSIPVAPFLAVGLAVKAIGAAFKSIAGPVDRFLEVAVSGIKAFGTASRAIFLNARESIRQLGHDLRPLTILVTVPFKVGTAAARGFFSLLTGRGGASQVERLASSFNKLSMQALRASTSVAGLANPLRSVTHITRSLPFGLGGTMTGPLSGQMILSTAIGLYAGSLEKAVRRAAEFQEVTGQVRTVFREASGEVFGFADRMAAEFGSVKHDLLDAAAVFGEFGKVAGLNDRAARAFALELTKLVPDIAAFTRMTTEEVQQALQSALRGRTMSLPPSLMFSDADVDAEIARMRGGKKDREEPASSSELIRARMSVMMGRARGSGIEGYLGRTANTPLNLLRETQGRLENRSVRTGQALMPAVKQILFLWNEVVESMSSKEGIIQKVMTRIADVISRSVKFIRSAFANWNEGVQLVQLYTRQKMAQAMEIFGWLPKVAGAVFAWLGSHGMKVLTISMDGIVELILGRSSTLFEDLGELIRKSLEKITLGVSNVFYMKDLVIGKFDKFVKEKTGGIIGFKDIMAMKEGTRAEEANKQAGRQSEEENRLSRLQKKLGKIGEEVGKFEMPELNLSSPFQKEIQDLAASIQSKTANLRGEGPEADLTAAPGIEPIETPGKEKKDKGLGQLVDLREFRAQMQEAALTDKNRQKELDEVKKKAEDDKKAQAKAEGQREKQTGEIVQLRQAFIRLGDKLVRGGFMGT